MKSFNIIVRSDNDQDTKVVNPISTEGLEFLPRLAGYEDFDFVIGLYRNKWRVWCGELGVAVVCGRTKKDAETSLKNLLYDLGRIEFDKGIKRTRLFLEQDGFVLPINDPSVFSQLNYRFEYESK